MNISECITNVIVDFVFNSKFNRFLPDQQEKIWDKPIVGFSDGYDPYYRFFKQDIGDFYLTPYEFLSKSVGNFEVQNQKLAVISWILPQTEKTKNDNNKNLYYPAKRWVQARLEGEDFNKKLAGHIVKLLIDKGIEAVAPLQSSIFTTCRSEKYGYASNWSERHAAFVSGLGTFGLCDGLITAAGKAIRCGSVIAACDITPTQRPYKSHNEYCLFFSKKGCMKCAERCPAGAITRNGHNKIKCSEYQRNVVFPFIEQEYSLRPVGCGLCQVGVPCETSIPDRREL